MGLKANHQHQHRFKILKIQNCSNFQNTKKTIKFGPKKFLEINNYEKSKKKEKRKVFITHNNLHKKCYFLFFM